jgi:DNA-binding NarL/FixJ family response regulator
VTRSAGEHQLHIGIEVLKSVYEEMTVFLRRKPAQKENVADWRETPLPQPPGHLLDRRLSSIWHLDRFAVVFFAKVTLQGARNNHGDVGSANRGRFSRLQHSRCDPAPFATLPIEPLHRHNGLFSDEARKQRKQRWSETVIMHNIVVRHHGIDSAQRGMDEGLRVSYPKAAPVLLAKSDDRDQVISALRAGAKGIFLFAETPFPMLCNCIDCVFRGQIWLNSQQTNYALEALAEVPTLRVVNSNGRLLLTPREEQVVALVADGLTSRGVATELGLGEHTIKKYLLRIVRQSRDIEPCRTRPLCHVAL